MYEGKKLSVVVPCYNEETQIVDMLSSIPSCVDKVFVIDDKSSDKTVSNISTFMQQDSRIELIVHSQNSGVGAAIASGYKAARDQKFDITVVMAGDGQMDPKDLESVIRPIANDIADYVKGNRFFYLNGKKLKDIPKVRLFGNFVLSALTKIVSGYWHVSDTQCGYTSINLFALKSIDWDLIYPRYGCPNDILTRLNIIEARVAEVPVNPLYHVGEVSKMKIPRVIFPILALLSRLFLVRLFYKYTIRLGHPIVLAYLLLGSFAVLSLALLIYIGIVFANTGLIPKVALISFGVAAILGVQFALNAFQMDFEFNERLYIPVSLPQQENTNDDESY